ncbi:MAG: hypothetical protein LQ343_006289 [Gyalolechia ehrenbergii]|nr:MAG: hypothetical protein LQ343_006289 [Gyalolechia ehrenbergii]
MASPQSMNITLATTTSEPARITFSSPATRIPSNPTTAALNAMTSLPSTPAANPRTNPMSAPSTTTSMAISSSVFSTISLGFPRLIDMDMYFPGLSRPSNVDVPDLVATVLYNYSIVTGKNALAAFLDLANTEFDFVWENFTGRPLQVNLHIERDGDMVLCGYQIEPGVWQYYYVYRIGPSGVWTSVEVDTERSNLLVAHDASDASNLKVFIEDILSIVKSTASMQDKVIEVVVKHGI